MCPGIRRSVSLCTNAWYRFTWLLGNVPSLSIAFTWVTLLPTGSPSSTVSCSRSVNSGISSLTSSSMMYTVASEASCWAPLFWRNKIDLRLQNLTHCILLDADTLHFHIYVMKKYLQIYIYIYIHFELFSLRLVIYTRLIYIWAYMHTKQNYIIDSANCNYANTAKLLLSIVRLRRFRNRLGNSDYSAASQNEIYLYLFLHKRFNCARFNFSNVKVRKRRAIPPLVWWDCILLCSHSPVGG